MKPIYGQIIYQSRCYENVLVAAFITMIKDYRTVVVPPQFIGLGETNESVILRTLGLLNLSIETFQDKDFPPYKIPNRRSLNGWTY